jgi:hypothetical protein
MNLHIQPFSPDYLAGIQALNQKFDAAQVNPGLRLPERWANGSQLPFGSPAALPFEERQYLVLDGEQVVGGFMLQEQEFQLRGRLEWVTNIQAPISLGVVDREYASMGGWLVKAVLAKKPLLFALGMGGMGMPFPQLLQALRWRLEPVPFQFRVLRPARFLREIRMLQGTRTRFWAARVAAASGVGWVGLGMGQWASGLRAKGGKRIPPVSAKQVSSWDRWTDEIWEAYRPQCSLAGVRNCATMQLFQPLKGRLRGYQFFAADGRLVGWASVQARQMENSPHFGNLLVNTVLDSACLPGWEDSVVGGVTEECSGDGADMIVSNQQRKLWVEAFSKAGFLGGPSNYLLAMSPALTKELEPLAAQYSSVHISRADADGRWQL